MKKLNLFFSALMIIIGLNVNAQCVNTASINVSTGYDPVSMSYINAPGLDPMWKLLAAPASASGQVLNINGPAHVIPTSTAWADADFPGTDARYISPYNTSWSTFEYDNYPSGQAVIFEREFCICTNSSNDLVTFDLKLNADNWGAIDLVYPGGTVVNLINQTMPSSPPTSNFADNSPDVYAGSLNLATGTYILRASLRNNGSISGLSMYGFIYSSGLISDSDCSDSATIAGYKFSDTNFNGVVDGGSDPALSNWTIELKDTGGNVISSTQTDGTGFYSFTVASGSYIVQEVNQSGWTMVLPSTGLHNITVAPNSVNQLDFLNSQGSISTPCEQEIEFEYSVFNCAVQFDLSNLTLPTGYQVVDVNWDFADGTSSSDMNPVHYFDNTGTYNVCVSIRIFNGEECCVLEKCEKVDIEKLCPDGCDLEAEPQYDGEECTVYFYANPYLWGSPIASYFWAFGDGSTSTDMDPSHTYTQSGTYEVSLFIFGMSEDGECCFNEFRMEVDVQCEFGKTSSITPMDNNLNNVNVYPNPTEEEFVLTFETTDESPVEAQLYDVQGRLLENLNFQQTKLGVNKFAIGAKLPNGIFILQIKQGDELKVLQLIKQ